MLWWLKRVPVPVVWLKPAAMRFPDKHRDNEPNSAASACTECSSLWADSQTERERKALGINLEQYSAALDTDLEMKSTT